MRPSNRAATPEKQPCLSQVLHILTGQLSLLRQCAKMNHLIELEIRVFTLRFLEGHKSENWGIMMCKYMWGCRWLHHYWPFSSKRVLCFYRSSKLFVITTALPPQRESLIPVYLLLKMGKLHNRKSSVQRCLDGQGLQIECPISRFSNHSLRWVLKSILGYCPVAVFLQA